MRFSHGDHYVADYFVTLRAHESQDYIGDS